MVNNDGILIERILKGDKPWVFKIAFNLYRNFYKKIKRS